MVADDELTKLQLLVMEHEQTLERYSELLLQQQRQIDLLRKEIDRLESRISRLDEPADSVAGHEPPPHY